MGSRQLRILMAGEASIEHIEASIERMAATRGYDLLLLVEGRDGIAGQTPTIDTEDASEPAHLDSDAHDQLLSEIGGVIEDTRWYADTHGESTDRQAIEEKLITAAITIDGVLARYRPHVILVWNGLLGVRAVLVDRAQRRGIPVLFCERGALPGSWYADSRGVNAASSIAVLPLPAELQSMLDSPPTDNERAAILARLDQTATAGASAWEQAVLRGPDTWRSDLGLEPGQPVLFFPMQVDADTNMRFFSPHFSGSLPALSAVAQAVRSMPGWLLLVKPHPKGSYPSGAIERAIGSAGRCVTDINLHDALALSTLVVTINSTVACEAAWSGKPVLQLGKGILSGKRIVAEYDPACSLAEQLVSAVQQWYQEPGRRDRGLQFYRYLHDKYLMQVGDDAETDRLAAQIESMTPQSGLGDSADSAQTVANAQEWLPARKLLDSLAACRPTPEQVVLVGYGRNARKLLAMVRSCRAGAELRWAAWDDNPESRARALQDGLTICDVRERVLGSLMVVTPKKPDALIRSLSHLGYKPDHDYLVMFPTFERNARAVSAETQVSN